MRVGFPLQRHRLVSVLHHPRSNFFFPPCHAAFFSFPCNIRIPMLAATVSAAGIAIQTLVMPKSTGKSNKSGGTRTTPRNSSRAYACLSRVVDAKYVTVNRLNPRNTQLVKQRRKPSIASRCISTLLS